MVARGVCGCPVRSTLIPAEPMSANGIDVLGTPPSDACNESIRPTITSWPSADAARGSKIVEAVHDRVRRCHQVDVDGDRFGRRPADEVVGSAFEDVADEVGGVSERSFEVAVGPASAVEAAFVTGQWGHGRSSTEIVPVASRLTSR